MAASRATILAAAAGKAKPFLRLEIGMIFAIGGRNLAVGTADTVAAADRRVKRNEEVVVYIFSDIDIGIV